MPDTIPAGTTTTEPANTTGTPSVLGTSDQPKVSEGSSVLDTAGAEAKAEADAESKRLLAADPTTLNADEQLKREGIVKEQEAAKAKSLADEKAKGVPDKYEFKLPDGMILPQENYDKIAPVFKAEGLTQKQAQSMFDLHMSMTKADSDRAAADMKAFHESSAKETMEALGPNAKTELAYVAKVKNMFSPETLQLLNDSGMGNIKSFIFDLAKIGKMFSEEKNVDTGNSSAAGGVDDKARKMFPSASDNK